jgi:hypothetical protein
LLPDLFVKGARRVENVPSCGTRAIGTSDPPLAPSAPLEER